MQYKINKSYILTHYLKIIILLKFYVSLFRKLKKLEKFYNFDGNQLNMTEIIYPNKVRKDTFTYNSRDLLETETSGSGAEASTIEYKYTDNGNLFSQELLDSELQKITFGYDGHGRKKRVTGPFSTVTYGYDPNSNLKTVDVVGNSVGKALNFAYDYDQLNRLTHNKLKKADGAFITTGFGYNEASHLNSMTTPNNHTWDITPNGAGLPGIVEDPLDNKDEYKYYNHGLVKEVTELKGPVTLFFRP